MIELELINKPKSFVKIIGDLKEKEFVLISDSRKIKNENLFICLYGENFDAHQFIESLSETSCKNIIVESEKISEEKLSELSSKYSMNFIVTKNNYRYLEELAEVKIEYWNRDNNKIIIGLTGSAGKTSTKECLSHLLNSILPNKVLTTLGNLNNQIGVPLTIVRIEEKHGVAIIEMGTNSPGEIKRLAEIAKPNAGLIVNIGEAHLEKLINLDGVFEEKTSLYFEVKKNTDGKGPFVIPFDDNKLIQLKDEAGIIGFSETEGDYNYIKEKDSIELSFDNEKIKLEDLKVKENHLVKNLIQSFILAKTLFPDKVDSLKLATSCYEISTKNRSEEIVLENKKIYLDAYNANPLSMRASLKSYHQNLISENVNFEDILIVLGDMKELGDEEKTLHQKMGAYLTSLNFKHAVFVGEFAKQYESGFTGKAHTFSKTTELQSQWESLSDGFKYIFLKGSRALQLESIVAITK